MFKLLNFVSGWSGLLSKKNLELAGKKMKEKCGQCTVNVGSCDTPAILSACLVSLESLTSFHIMADAFKIEEKMSSNCPLQTPRDASTTHILVFPTSAIAQVFMISNVFPFENLWIKIFFSIYSTFAG